MAIPYAFIQTLAYKHALVQDIHHGSHKNPVCFKTNLMHENVVWHKNCVLHKLCLHVFTQQMTTDKDYVLAWHVQMLLAACRIALSRVMRGTCRRRWNGDDFEPSKVPVGVAQNRTETALHMEHCWRKTTKKDRQYSAKFSKWHKQSSSKSDGKRGISSEVHPGKMIYPTIRSR